MCDHKRTTITTPDNEGKAIKQCKDCGYAEQIIAGFYAVEDALRTGIIRTRTRTVNDFAPRDDGYTFGKRMEATRGKM